MTMTDNELKLEVLRLAFDTARETMYARRTEVENEWQHRVAEKSFPELPTINVDEVIATYDALIKAVCKRNRR